jgi:hypothetical protein
VGEGSSPSGEGVGRRELHRSGGGRIATTRSGLIASPPEPIGWPLTPPASSWYQRPEGSQ